MGALFNLRATTSGEVDLGAKQKYIQRFKSSRLFKNTKRQDVNRITLRRDHLVRSVIIGSTLPDTTLQAC